MAGTLDKAMAWEKPHTPFMENLFIVNHKRKHKFLSVAKAGSTTLKALAIHDDKIFNKSRVQNSQEVHSLLGWVNNDKSMLSIESQLFPKYKRVAVYRDPLERVTSWYKDKLFGLGNDIEPGLYYLQLDLICENDYSRIINFLKFETTKRHSEFIDEHLRPITRYINQDQFDILVKLEHLDDYLKSIGSDTSVIKDEQKNATKHVEFEFPPYVQDEIREIYKDDIDWIKDNDKLWTPDKRSLFKKLFI